MQTFFRFSIHRNAFSPRSLWNGLFLVSALMLTPFDRSCAGILIEVGQVELLPDRSGQEVSFFARNTTAQDIFVAGLTLNVQVEDSGPGALGTVLGPTITGMEVLVGTPFSLNNTGQVNPGSAPQFANRTTTTQSGTIALPASDPFLLGTVTFDTTGFFAGESFQLILGATINGSTAYFDESGTRLVPEILDGLLVVVPEPASMAWVGGFLLSTAWFWRRYRS